MDALDQLDRRRFDVEALVQRANVFAELPAAEQDELEFHEYVGLDDATHALSAFLPELHNACYIVRDLDGALRLVWEDLYAHVHGGTRWHQTPLIKADLVSDEEIEDIDWGVDAPLDPVLVKTVVEALPDDPQD
jgi:hypothetical protein